MSSPVRTGQRPALMVVLHGTLQTGRSVRRFAGWCFDEFAADGQAVVAYPDAVGREWNGARAAAMLSMGSKHVDDVGFLRALIHELTASRKADPSRVYVVGFSLGGQMAIRLVHEAPDVLAGAAIISATMPAPSNFVTAIDDPKALPILIIHGTADPFAPFGGGVASLRGRFPRGLHLSAPDTAAYFAARNSCREPPVVAALPEGGTARSTSVRRYDYADGEAPVRFFAVEGGGHVIPNALYQPPQWLLGPAPRHFDAAGVIADFFGLATLR